MLAKKRLKWSLAAAVDSLIKLLSPLIMNGQRQMPSGVSNDCCSALFLCLDNLGDAVMATPAIEAYKTKFPRAKLVVMTRPINEAVFVNNPYIDEIVLDDAPWWSSRPLLNSLRPSYWLAWRSKIKELRKEAFDVVVDFRGDLRHILMFGRILHPKMVIGYARTGGATLLSSCVSYDETSHEIDKKLKLLQPLGISQFSPRPRLWLSDDEILAAQKRIENVLGRKPRPLVLMDPGAKPVQQWPTDRFADLAEALRRDFGAQILLSSGPPYSHLVKRIVDLTGPHVAKPIGSLDLRSLMATVACCDLVISADTGIVHVASALEIPAVTLFGPTDPGRFWHGNKHSVIVKSEEVPCCTTELHEVCTRSRPGEPGVCMSAIATHVVLAAAAGILYDATSDFSAKSNLLSSGADKKHTSYSGI